MAMSRAERATKSYIYQKLREEGYPTYADIFAKLDLNLTAHPAVVGYMDPKTGTITINRNLEEDQFSVIIRHEILHNYLRHEKRLLDHLAEMRGIDPDDLDDLSLNELKQFLYGNDTFNIAADYEISNRGYTEEDKQTVRNILLNGQTLSGLVTEDKHPEWVTWDVEDMYDELLKEREQAKQDAQDDIRDSQGDSDSNQTDDTRSGNDNSQSQTGDGQQSGSEPQGDGSQSQGNADGDGQSGSQGQDSQSDSNKSGDAENGQSGNQSKSDKSKDSQGEGSQSKVVYGKFVDENTFIDRNGNIVKIGG